MTQSPNNCLNCRYAVPVESQPGNAQIIGQKQAQCRRMPPTACAVPTPQGIAMLSAWPIVNEQMYCSEFDSENELNG